MNIKIESREKKSNSHFIYVRNLRKVGKEKTKI